MKRCTAQKADVRRLSFHERRRAVCFANPATPMIYTFSFSRANFSIKEYAYHRHVQSLEIGA